MIIRKTSLHAILLCSLFLILFVGKATGQTFRFGTAVNPMGETIEVDQKGMIVNGKHVIPVMGEIHYSRVPATDWRREIRKMRAGGITIVSTYIFWNHHEAIEGRWNWNGNRDLHRFLEICKEERMPVVIRVGPFCHGEVYQGGMPDWIVERSLRQGFKLRTEAPAFMSAVQTLYSNIYTQVSDMLWKNGGTVIGMQIENECRGPWSYYMALKDMAVRTGFDVPFYTRTGWPKLNGGEKRFGEMLPLFGDYADGFWDRVLTDMPGDYKDAFIMKDNRMSTVIATETFSKEELAQGSGVTSTTQAYPYLTCELGGGMMQAYHRRINISGREIMPLAVCKLGSGSNLPGYYMYHGGTNPEYDGDGVPHTMAETQASPVTNYNDMPLKSYDFQSPLGEMGQLNETAFHESRWLHQFLSDWGEELSLMPVDTLSRQYARRGCFEFRNDYVRILNEEGSASVSLNEWKHNSLTISTIGIQPFALADNGYWFITIKGARKYQVKVNGKTYTLKADKPQTIQGRTFMLLSPEKARTAFVIDGKMLYARNGGILYKDNKGNVIEESWKKTDDVSVQCSKRQDATGLRTVAMGKQKVAAMPTDEDFSNASVWDIDITAADATVNRQYDNTFLRINYKGDVARLYADGRLIEDNFWNGKPMLVRMSDIVGKKIELRILPLGKDYPIYLQKEQRMILDNAPASGLLELNSVEVMSRVDVSVQGVIDLSGTWQFMIDRSGNGEADGWYNPEHSFDDTIDLPGSMPERLKGDLVSVHTPWVGALYDSSYYFNPYMEKYRVEGNMKLPFFLTPARHYVGRAWYKRTVSLTAAEARRGYVLYLERPHIISKVWVNGKELATPEQNSLSVPHTHIIAPGDILRAGENTIVICIDNDPVKVNVGQDSHSVTDQTQGCWNGIAGAIELRPTSRLSSMKVYPDVDNHKAVVKLALSTLTGKKEKTVVTLAATAFNTSKSHTVTSAPVTVVIGKGGVANEEVTLDMGADCLLWDEFCPQLYRLVATVTTGKETETHETVFGMRKIEIKDRMFYVNGREIQLRGNVENCLFPNTGYPPTDLDSWIRIYRRCKEFGLNHVRFHSYCPPEAAFLAADIVGFYIQPEGPSWPNHGVKLGRGEYIDTYLYDETRRICDEYGNHPSFTFIAFGNEPAGNWVKWCNDHVPMIKEYDPRHLCPGFSVGGGWAWQPKAEFAVKAGARGLAEWVRRAPEATTNFEDKITTYNGKDMPGTPITVPFVTHEMGQWCVFPNFDEIPKYTGVNKARNFEIFRDILRDNGMECRAKDFLLASGKLQTLCYKYETERILRTPKYAGFQILSINDYSGQGSALVGVTDVFYGDKGYCKAADFREFCSPVVPLAVIPKFTYTNAETFKAELSVNNYSPAETRGIRWTIADENGNQIAEGTASTVSFPLSGINKAQRLTLSVVATTSDNSIQGHNHWDFWVYETPEEGTAKDVKGIHITDTLDQKALDILRKGGDVLVCAAGKVRYGNNIVQQFLPVFWNTSWFKMRPPHTTGLFIDHEHPVFRHFPTSYHSDLQWWELVNRAQVMQLTQFPRDFQPLVQSIDTWFLSRKIGMLFEARVLNGRLMMTTMDITTSLANRHAARQMRRSILQYMQSPEFRPQYTIAPELITNLFENEAPKVDMFTNDSPDELKPSLIEPSRPLPVSPH